MIKNLIKYASKNTRSERLEQSARGARALKTAKLTKSVATTLYLVSGVALFAYSIYMGGSEARLVGNLMPIFCGMFCYLGNLSVDIGRLDVNNGMYSCISKAAHYNGAIAYYTIGLAGIIAGFPMINQL